MVRMGGRNKPKFSFGVVTALPLEFAPMQVMLDHWEKLRPIEDDPNVYVRGDIAAKNGKGLIPVILTLLPGTGNNRAAESATHLLRSFKVDHLLMVGIAGGVPNHRKPKEHVRLGDVVVSDKVIQYDYGSFVKGKNFLKGSSSPPSDQLLSAVKFLEAERIAGRSPWESYIERASELENAGRPPMSADVLHHPTKPKRILTHPTDKCRRPGHPKVLYGPIGSGNVVMKDARRRDALRKELGLLAIEMEGSGISDASKGKYLVVRGICDYCDIHKNDVWQPYAAVAAAAYARALIELF
ncbi:5'-methylthioadenosine/S-adenosylhomocysteine nucleosidase [Streptomyces sp. NPDC007206]|uniref:5'-methylthioadenosine/S-adenosylhomocysteine nucleosidase n=1 Tax=Streptomyces sp. NPDC007206 TaxID=3154317 RepID=UPI00340A7D9F